MNKVTNIVPAAAVNAALASWSFGEQKLTFIRLIRENIVPVLTAALVVAEILTDLLDMEDIRSERAENGQIAVDMFNGQPAGYYDAILMDVRMPVMNGLDATRAIRAEKDTCFL